MLRACLFHLIQTISIVLFCPLAVAATVLPSVPRGRFIANWARFNIWTLRHLCGITFSVRGAENLPSEPCIILSNHQSTWETFCFQLIFPPQSYLLKWQLLWIPFFGWGLAANRPISINRTRKTHALAQLTKQGAIRLREGRWLVIFPEGTRRKPGELGEFQLGGAFLAAKTGAPVLPVVHNAGVFWGKSRLRKTRGEIQVRIGKPILSRGKKARQINAEAEDWIRRQLAQLPQTP